MSQGTNTVATTGRMGAFVLLLLGAYIPVTLCYYNSDSLVFLFVVSAQRKLEMCCKSKQGIRYYFASTPAGSAKSGFTSEVHSL